MGEIMLTNREAAKISALPSGKMDKCEYLIGEIILLSDQNRFMNLLILQQKSQLKACKNN